MIIIHIYFSITIYTNDLEFDLFYLINKFKHGFVICRLLSVGCFLFTFTFSFYLHFHFQYVFFYCMYISEVWYVSSFAIRLTPPASFVGFGLLHLEAIKLSSLKLATKTSLYFISKQRRVLVFTSTNRGLRLRSLEKRIWPLGFASFPIAQNQQLQLLFKSLNYLSSLNMFVQSLQCSVPKNNLPLLYTFTKLILTRKREKHEKTHKRKRKHN